MLIYNSENECYSRFIPIDQAAEIQEKIKKLEARLQNMPVNPIDQAECTDELDIDDVNSLKKLLKTENFNINMPISLPPSIGVHRRHWRFCSRPERISTRRINSAIPRLFMS